MLIGMYYHTQGDSGGPLVMKDINGVWRIAGITSFGSLCAGTVHITEFS